MLNKILELSCGFYPWYEFNSGLVYFYGWVDNFKNKELTTTFGYIQKEYRKHKGLNND